jgi:hypothetical protein
MMLRTLGNAPISFAAVVPVVAQGQQTPACGKLSIDGSHWEARIVVIQGKRFVELDEIVPLLQAARRHQRGGNHDSPAHRRLFRGPRLTVPVAWFLDAGIKVISAICEWRQGIIHAVKNSPGFLDQIVVPLRRAADAKSAVAAAAVSTAADRSALDFLQKETDLIRRFSDRYLERQQNFEYVSSEEINGDPLGKQILDCARDMASMAASHQFQDVLACH